MFFLYIRYLLTDQQKTIVVKKISFFFIKRYNKVNILYTIKANKIDSEQHFILLFIFHWSYFELIP